jgi:hypothetical protein
MMWTSAPVKCFAFNEAEWQLIEDLVEFTLPITRVQRLTGSACYATQHGRGADVQRNRN